MQRSALVVLVAMLSVVSCGGEPTTDDPAAGEKTSSPSQSAPPSASKSAAPSPSQAPATSEPPAPSPSEPASSSPSDADHLALAFESPCKGVERSVGGDISQLLGGNRGDTSFFKPGDKTPSSVPTHSYACIFSSADSQAQFGVVVRGEPMTEQEFKAAYVDQRGCRPLAVPADLGASATAAASCPAGNETSIRLSALYGERLLTCTHDLPTSRNNRATTDFSVDLCMQINLQTTKAG